MKTTMKWLSVFGLFVAGAFAFAQERPNSAQYHAVHNPDSPYYSGTNQQPVAPQVRWVDRWGAFASDGRTYGIVADASSEREAEKAAIEECKKRGGGGCEPRFSYRSQCAAIVASERSKFFNGAPDAKEAEVSAMQRCEAEGGKGACWLYYSGCSLPVQAQ